MMNNLMKTFLICVVIFNCSLEIFCQEKFSKQGFADMMYWITYDFSGMRIPYIKSYKQREVYEEELLKLFNERIGVYESDDVSRLKCGDFYDATTLIIKIGADARPEIFKKNAEGHVDRLKDSYPGVISDDTMFFGPREAGYLFLYCTFSNTIFTLYSPNGIQAAIRFNKISEMPPAEKLPSEHEYVRDVRINGHKDSQNVRKMPSGFFVTESAYKYMSESEYERQYLICKDRSAYSLWYKNSTYWIDRFGDTDINSIIGPFGRYSYDGTNLVFCSRPIGPDYFRRMRLIVAKKLGFPTNRIQCIERELQQSENNLQQRMENYFNGDFILNKTHFKRCEAIGVTKENMRIRNVTFDTTTPENVEYYLKLLGLLSQGN